MTNQVIWLSQTVIGIPNFNVTDIDPKNVADALQPHLLRGSQFTGVSQDDITRTITGHESQLTGVSLDDITRTIKGPVPEKKDINLSVLLSKGMKLFDALVWLSAGQPTTHPLETDPAIRDDEIVSLFEVARSVFYVWFFLLTQARYPVHANEPNKPRVANFLKTIMGLTEEQHVYVEPICTFAPQKMNPEWVKFVKFPGFGRESISRFGLCVAGYRYFSPFETYAHKPNLEPNLIEAYAFAREVARAPATWDLHPLTRRPDILTSRGNLTKNLGNLILDCFTEDQISEMVANKVLHATPVRQEAYNNYKTWSREDDISGRNQIFDEK